MSLILAITVAEDIPRHLVDIAEGGATIVGRPIMDNAANILREILEVILREIVVTILPEVFVVTPQGLIAHLLQAIADLGAPIQGHHLTEAAILTAQGRLTGVLHDHTPQLAKVTLEIIQDTDLPDLGRLLLDQRALSLQARLHEVTGQDLCHLLTLQAHLHEVADQDLHRLLTLQAHLHVVADQDLYLLTLLVAPQFVFLVAAVNTRKGLPPVVVRLLFL